MLKFHLRFCFFIYYTLSAIFADDINFFSDLELDANGHLASHWILHSADEECTNRFVEQWSIHSHPQLRRISSVSKMMARILFKNSSECSAVCLERGTPADKLPFPIPTLVYTPGGDTADFIKHSCDRIEVGFISYHENPAIIYWISGERRYDVGKLLHGEKNSAWHKTFLGHEFELIDNITGHSLGKYIAEFNSINVIGKQQSNYYERENVERDVRNTFDFEYTRSRRVQRTFTELGFKKGVLPYDLWGSIQAYYYNNRNHLFIEEQGIKGVLINRWQSQTKMIAMPWGLKGYWQTRLRELVQDWIGQNNTLENTDIYGMRRYEDGARLLSHVDREATHAASLIVNVAQSNIREPWTVEIYDHADRLHEIEMNPGDIVYYESARCLHGRMKPLQGAYYVNLFAHYRPIGDPEWFLKPNPEGTVPPLIDLSGDCYTNEDNTQTCDPPITLPTLSPTGHVVKGPDDLFEYWKLASPQPQDSRRRDEL